MKEGYMFLVRMLCGLCLAGGLAACQKLDLPSEEGEDKEQPGQTGGKPGEEGNTPSSPENVGGKTVAMILSEYEGVDLEEDYEEKVVGYIVGACKNTIKNALFTADEIRAAGISTNLLIADSKDEKDASRCMPVELKKGSDVRDEANLVDNPQALGRRIGLFGLVKKYFGVVGLKDVVFLGWLTNGGNEDEPKPDEPDKPGTPDNPKPDVPDTLDSDKKDTIGIDTVPEHIEGGRSIRTK